MTETKYGKYFFRFEEEQKFPLGNILARFDDTFMPGSFTYFVHWIMPNQDLLAKDEFKVGHPPHVHKEAELLFYIGMNPEDPTDLGAEMEFHMGEELERHVIKESIVIFIPPMVVHAPWRPIKLEKPFIFIEVNQAPQKTEKFFPELLPDEHQKIVNMDMWQDVGFD